MEINKDQITLQVVQEYEAGLKFKQPRIKDWQQTEDQYFGKVQKTLKGRFNVPLPIMSGFIDTLHAKIDDPPALKFNNRTEADYRISKKMQAAYETDSTLSDNDWETIDLDGKKQASLYGRAIAKYYASSDPKYKSTLELVDVYDLNCDPMGGADLENHKFVSQDCIFKNKSDLMDGANSGLYDKGQIFKIVNATAADTIAQNDNVYFNKANRFAALGLDNKMYNFAGQGLYKFIEAGTTWNGKRYYVLFNYETKKWIRIAPWDEVFKSGLWHWASWAPMRDSFNFWSKAPADDIRPIAEVIKVLANQELDNRNKQNYGQRAYDPAIFPNPSELEFRQDGLIAIKAGTSAIQQIERGIYQFTTPQLNGTINLVDWLDKMLGTKSGITPDAQGNSDESKVGVYYGNMQQVADRLGLQNKYYRKFWSAIGRRYAWGLSEHLNEPMAVKLIGDKGIEWDELKKKEVDPDLDIKVVGGNAEIKLDEVKKQQRQAAIQAIVANPALVTQVGPKWTIEEMLRNGGYEDEEIRLALDTQNYGNKDQLAKAAEAIEDLMNKKQPKLNRGANTAFVQKLIDFANDNTDGNPPLFTAIMKYAAAHKQIIAENMTRQAMPRQPAIATSGQPVPAANPPQINPGQPPQGMPPAPGTPHG